MAKTAESYLRYGCKLVDGWLLPDAARMIVALARKQEETGVHGNVAEIGVHHGKLFLLLALLARPNETALAVDLFDEQDKNIDKSGSGDLAKFKQNLSRHAHHCRVVIHQGDSTQMGSTDLIHSA